MFFFMSLLLSCHYRQVSCGIVLFLLEKKRSPLFRGGTRVLHGAPHAREHHQIPEGPKQNNAFFFWFFWTVTAHTSYVPIYAIGKANLIKKKSYGKANGVQCQMTDSSCPKSHSTWKPVIWSRAVFFSSALGSIF